MTIKRGRLRRNATLANNFPSCLQTGRGTLFSSTSRNVYSCRPKDDIRRRPNRMNEYKGVRILRKFKNLSFLAAVLITNRLTTTTFRRSSTSSVALCNTFCALAPLPLVVHRHRQTSLWFRDSLTPHTHTHTYTHAGLWLWRGPDELGSFFLSFRINSVRAYAYNWWCFNTFSLSSQNWMNYATNIHRAAMHTAGCQKKLPSSWAPTDQTSSTYLYIEWIQNSYSIVIN